MQNRNQKLTIDTLLNNRPVFDDLMTDPETGKPMKRATFHIEDMMLDISNQDGIIELPEHLM